MRFDLTNLNHQDQRQFLESIRDCYIEDSYYRVFYDSHVREFLLIKVDAIIKNKVVNE
jgi:hypothetical protein